MKTLSIVVPVYNEEKTLAYTHERLVKLGAVPNLSSRLEIIYVDDGSQDKTPVMLDHFQATAAGGVDIKVIHFARNFGHSAAVTAGLAESTGDLIAIIDADLQDPPELVPEMVALVERGWDVVYGQRTARLGETHLKRLTAWLFYRILNLLTGVEIPRDTGDFRVITREVRDALLLCNDQEPFLRGLVAWVGFQQKAFPYVREPRRHGTTKYPFGKMVKFANNAILSFSSSPLRIATHAGLVGMVLSVLIGLWALWAKLTGRTVSGWTSLLDGTLIGQSFILLCIGFIGSYTARIYRQVQGRPRFIIRQRKDWPDRGTGA
ncbi:MAG: glycosyltransferase family 2 protein [Verrucomicrobiia bacterium]